MSLGIGFWAPKHHCFAGISRQRKKAPRSLAYDPSSFRIVAVVTGRKDLGVVTRLYYRNPSSHASLSGCGTAASLKARPEKSSALRLPHEIELGARLRSTCSEVAVRASGFGSFTLYPCHTVTTRVIHSMPSDATSKKAEQRTRKPERLDPLLNVN